MKIAVITDVHGNLGALEAVLAHSKRLGVDETVVAGDTVNVLPHSKACWDLVLSRGLHLLLGNHEFYVATYGTPEADPVWMNERFKGLAWVQSQFGADDLAAMRGLPLTYRLPGLLVTHASPRSVYDSVEESTPEETLREMFGVPETLGVPEMLVVRGHNHSWLERRWDDRTLVTVASCGLPLKGRLEAQYALLTFTKGRWHYEKQFVPYDREAALASLDAHYLEMMGPLGHIFERELATGKNHLLPFLFQNLPAVERGDVTLAEAVKSFLAEA